MSRFNPELDEFLHQVGTWHAARVDHLRTIQDIVKEGTRLKVGDDEDFCSVMTARDAAFFKCGIEAALVELGELPYTVTHEAGDEFKDSE